VIALAALVCLDTSIFPYDGVIVVLFDELCDVVVGKYFFLLFVIDGA
jgi:hypothetical protein